MDELYDKREIGMRGTALISVSGEAVIRTQKKRIWSTSGRGRHCSCAVIRAKIINKCEIGCSALGEIAFDK